MIRWITRSCTSAGERSHVYRTEELSGRQALWAHRRKAGACQWRQASL